MMESIALVISVFVLELQMQRLKIICLIGSTWKCVDIAEKQYLYST